MRELPFKIAIIVGVPRSGATFLQALLALHRDVVTARETNLFDHYSGSISDIFSNEGDIIDQESLFRAFHLLEVFTLVGIYKRDPTASLVLEKTPSHLERMSVIRACLPDARFIHIVRDPRGVAASTKAERREEWGGWADKDVASAAHRWLRSIAIATQQSEDLGGSYRQVRYEDLFVKGGAVVNDLYAWLGLPTVENLPADMSSRLPIREMANPSDIRNEQRERFFRSGQPLGWQAELSAEEIAEIEEICGSYMRHFGYPATVQPAPGIEPRR